jgi:hypothetical protein
MTKYYAIYFDTSEKSEKHIKVLADDKKEALRIIIAYCKLHVHPDFKEDDIEQFGEDEYRFITTDIIEEEYKNHKKSINLKHIKLNGRFSSNTM